jgi:antitoxin component YwqK of YwqJK toxin-antitoxin module
MQNHREIRIYLLGLFIVFFLQGFSQKLIKTYYDFSWKLTTKNLAYYCRVGFIDTINYQYYGVVNDYYIATGKLQMTGNYLANSKNGSFNFFYPDGTLKTEGFYLNNIRAGTWSNYYTNGGFKDKVLYDNFFIKALAYYDTNGVQKLSNGTGEWQTEFFNDISYEYIEIKGNYLNSKMEGTWNHYSRKLTGGIPGKSELQRSEKYHNGKFIKGTRFRNGLILDVNSPIENMIMESGKFYNTETWQLTKYASIEEYPNLKFLNKIDSTVFPVDSFAVFPGGMDSVATAIWREIKLPKSYVKEFPTSMYFIEFFVDQNGKVIIKDEKNYEDIFYKQAIQSIRKLKDWKPAKRNSQDVINYFIVRILEKDGHVMVDLMSDNELTGTYKSGIVYYY